jgi:5'-phosphate synthase pdxT subunit
MKIGVLALQGAVIEHVRMIEQLGESAVVIKQSSQLQDIDALIIPGGESTTIGKLMATYGFIEAIRTFSAQQKPIFGTCAGLILLASNIADQEKVYLSLMDIAVVRNAYGRQRESFEVDLGMKGWSRPVRAVFIRAPLIRDVGPDVDILACHQDGIVAVRQGHLLGASFHPELTDDNSMHEYFLTMVKEYTSPANTRL